MFGRIVLLVGRSVVCYDSLELMTSLANNNRLIQCARWGVGVACIFRPSWEHVEKLVEEVHEMQVNNKDWRRDSTLAQICPSIGIFHTKLPLASAFEV